MNLTILIVVLYAVIAGVCTKPNDNHLSFRNGSTAVSFDVSAEAYNPQGLRVFISHKPGLELLTFHGKIKTSKGEYGEHFAQDITMNTNGYWVFEDSKRKLRVGDTLHFWIFMQYNGTGQRFNDLVYNVMNLTPGPIDISTRQGIPITASIRPTTPLYFSPTTPRRKPQGTPDCTCNKDTLTDMWEKMNTTANKVLILEQTISPLKDKIKSLTETIDELIDIENVGTSLLLTGNLPAETNAVEDVRHLLIEKLNLRDLSSSIIQAQYECGKIAFEVTSPVDKLRILKRSRDILSKLAYRIEDPKRRETTEAEGTCNDSIQIDPRFYVDDDDPNAYSSPKVPPTHPLNVKTAIKIQRGDAA